MSCSPGSSSEGLLKPEEDQSSCTGVPKWTRWHCRAGPNTGGEESPVCTEGLMSSEAFVPVVEVLEHSAQSPVSEAGSKRIELRPRGRLGLVLSCLIWLGQVSSLFWSPWDRDKESLGLLPQLCPECWQLCTYLSCDTVG